MPQVGLQRPRIDPVIRQLVAAGVAEHVTVRLDAEAGRRGGALDQLEKGETFVEASDLSTLASLAAFFPAT